MASAISQSDTYLHDKMGLTDVRKMGLTNGSTNSHEVGTSEL